MSPRKRGGHLGVFGLRGTHSKFRVGSFGKRVDTLSSGPTVYMNSNSFRAWIIQPRFCEVSFGHLGLFCGLDAKGSLMQMKNLARFVLPSLKLTAKAPENRWLEYDRFLLGPGLFSGAKMLVSGRVIFFFQVCFGDFPSYFGDFPNSLSIGILGGGASQHIHAKLCQNSYHLLPSKGQKYNSFIPVRGRFVSQHHSSHWRFAEIRFLMLLMPIWKLNFTMDTGESLGLGPWQPWNCGPDLAVPKL